MIRLTRLNGTELALNPDLIHRAEETPDTVLTLIDGSRYVVVEPLDELDQPGRRLPRPGRRRGRPAAPRPRSPPPLGPARETGRPAATAQPTTRDDEPGTDRRHRRLRRPAPRPEGVMDPLTLIGVGLGFVAIFVSTFLEGGNPMAMFLLPAHAARARRQRRGRPGRQHHGRRRPLRQGPRQGHVRQGRQARRLRWRPSSRSPSRRAARACSAWRTPPRQLDDPFLKEALELAIDGTDPEDLQDVLFGKIEAKRAHDKVGAKFFGDMGAYAPTLGIVGTVLGLVHVLEQLSEPEKLGHLIAAAFTATLWGVMIANVFFLPVSARLKRLSELEIASMEVVVEGVLAIQSGASPRVVARKLGSLLPPGSEKAATRRKAKAA